MSIEILGYSREFKKLTEISYSPMVSHHIETNLIEPRNFGEFLSWN